MQSFVRAARTAASVSATHGAAASASVAAAVAAAQPVRRAQAPIAADDWLVTEVDNETVLFRPYSAAEVDECVEDVRRLVSRPVGSRGINGVVIEEVSPESAYGSPATSRASSINGEGSSQADRVIEATHLDAAGAGVDPAYQAQQQQLQSLLQMTSKMLKRPGMQREVFAAMLEDPEVRTLMLRETRDLDAYLISCGIAAPSNLLTESDVTPSLFPAAAAAAANRNYPDHFDSDPPLAKLLGAIGNWLEEVTGKAASIAAFLGGWLRDRLNSLLSDEQRAAADAAHAAAANGGDANANAAAGGGGGGANTKAVLTKVMFLAVAIGVMLIVRRPLRLSRMAV